MIDLVILVYETDENLAELISILNQSIKNTALFKLVLQRCQESDQERHGSPRVRFVEQDGGRLLLNDGTGQMADTQQLQTDFPPGTCQFCLWEAQDPQDGT